MTSSIECRDVERLTGRSRPAPADPEQARTLELMRGDPPATVTIAQLQARGVRAPAQAVYGLQVAGHRIERVGCTDADGRRALGYRLADRDRAQEGTPATVEDRPARRRRSIGQSVPVAAPRR
ncbi:MAG: hypothetical protein ABSH51_08740 [Solirubrobacteraceae bacterium]